MNIYLLLLMYSFNTVISITRKQGSVANKEDSVDHSELSHLPHM